MTAKEYLGSSVEISEESKEFMAGVAERKAAQIAEREAARTEEGGNAFNGTGDFKQQYLVLSENLYNNGFYDKLSDEEVNRQNVTEILIILGGQYYGNYRNRKQLQ